MTFNNFALSTDLHIRLPSATSVNERQGHHFHGVQSAVTICIHAFLCTPALHLIATVCGNKQWHGITDDDLSRSCGGHAFMAVHHPFSGSIFVVSAERGKCDGLCSITAVSQAIDASVQCPS